ncbi:MAG: serine/threonine-protein kinase [Bryobacteraceae bacterium]|nr:serine/threonine-protein kinase [Bryobacteraceae bacterium]
MSLSRWDLVKEIFSAAAELPASEQRAYVIHACGGDLELQASVERLLAQAGPTASLGILPGPRHTFSPGDLVTPRFRIRRFVGAGGMGEVYEADDLELGGSIALKTLRPSLNDDKQFLGRFRREVQLARQVTHANICRIFDVGHDAGHTFLTMEFLDGETLGSYLRREGRLPVELAGRLMRQMAAGLAALHERGIIHRDLKPGNVMIAQSSSGPRAVISDFGLARAMEHSADSTNVTVAGHVLGTPDYMAPEQFQGEPASAASDIYALGLMMHEMVTGQRINAGSRFPLPDVPPDWERLILRCIDRDPARRPASASEVLTALSGERTLPPALPKPIWRHPLFLAGSAITCVALGFLLWRKPAKPEVRENDVVNTRLTSDPGLSFDPAISRDGKFVVYASDRGATGSLDLWLQQIGAGGSPIQLTQSSMDESAPDFSPDGTRIVFRSEMDGGGVYVVNALGGEPTLLAAGGHDPKFSPDGKSIAYWSGREASGYLPGSAQVRVMPAGGGESRAVAPGFAASLHPVWSPSGDALLCLARANDSSPAANSLDWYVFPLDGRPPARTGAVASLTAAKLSVPAIQTSDTPLAWLDKPSRAVFAASSGDSTNLFELEFDDQLKLSGRPRRITNGTTFEGQVSIAEHATRLVYSSLTLNYDIWGLPLDTERTQVSGPLRNLTKEESSETYPTLSVDGMVLAYRSRAAGVSSLRVMNLGTGKVKTLLSGVSSARYPTLSQNGQSLTYLDPSLAMVQMPVQGGVTRTLCQTNCGTPFDAGRDGQEILLEPIKPPDDILRFDTATGKTTPAVRARQLLLGARWSPDGKWIAFHEITRATGQVTIFVAPAGAEPAPAEQWIAITPEDKKARAPAWSPGGNALYFLSDRDGFRCLYAQPLHPSTKVPLGAAIAVQHLHAGGRSLKFLGDQDKSIGLSVGQGIAVLTLGELTGNIWQRETVR